MSQITKKELVREVQAALEAETGLYLSLDKIKAVLDAYSLTIENQLANGTEVRIDNVGLLQIRDFKATTARNLRTGEPIQVPATKRVRFRPVPSLKSAVKELAAV